MPGVFISYRRDDQPGFAGRLADSLGSVFGEDMIFRDSEDIQPGQDFVEVIESNLQSVSVMLVMIGPNWLTASRDGIRRLEEPADFVRREIEAGLESGKPVVPVLVNGAAMPSETDLPPTITALARHQAITLNDTHWAADMERLANILRPLLPAQRHLLRRQPMWPMAGLGVIALVLLLLALNLPWPGRPTDQSTLQPDPAASEMAQRLSGRWMAQVMYDWGVMHEEVFDLRVENTEIRGTASYLRLARIVEQGRLQTDRLSFITRSQEVQDDTPREVIHRYGGTLGADELHLRLESSGGYSHHPPVDFVARRIAE